MNEQGIRGVLERARAVITDSHFVLTSGKHSKEYVKIDELYPHTGATSYLCRALAEQFDNDNVNVVIGPGVGGAILSQWTAHFLTEMSGHEVLGIYAEKEIIGAPFMEVTNRFIIGHDYGKLVANKRVLVVDDVLTTGGTAEKVIGATRAAGGNVVGLGVLCNRGGVTAQDVANIPKLTVLVNMTLDSWDKNDCPLCRNGVPINTDVGHGKGYLDGPKQLRLPQPGSFVL